MTATTIRTSTEPAGSRARRGRRTLLAGAPRHQATARATRRTRLLAVAGAVLLVVAAAPVASAVLGVRVSGRGSSKVAAPKPFTAAAAPVGDLVPGGTAPAPVTVKNPYSRPVVVQAITPSPAQLADAGHPGCDPAAVGFAAVVDPALPAATIPAGGQATFAGAVTMATNAAAACQGATFRVPVVVSVRLS